jgi:hypothetical protein
MQKQRLLAGGCSCQPYAPLAFQLPHFFLSAMKLPNSVTDCTKLFLHKIQNAAARGFTSVTDSEDVREFRERESKLQSSLHKADAIRCIARI